MFMFICAILIPVMMTVIGLLIKKYPPKKINSVIGYRTIRSMKSNQAWSFAHRRLAQLYIPTGIVTALISGAAILIFWDYNETAFRIILAAQVIVLLLTVIPIEKALKKNFDENGNPGNCDG
jgi:uncharacterized membrane protein